MKDLQDNNLGFVYCGIHSNMIAYPPYSHINLLLPLKFFVSSQIHLRFAVTDQNRIVSSTRKIYEAVNPIGSLYFTKTNTFCEKFYLLYQKFKYLTIAFQVRTVSQRKYLMDLVFYQGLFSLISKIIDSFI